MIFAALVGWLIYTTMTSKLPSGSGQGPQKRTKEEFFNLFITAYNKVETCGIPYQLAYAVSAAETGYGNGNVFQNSRNLFSILCSPSWKGECYRGRPNSLTANPLGDSHRVYPDYESSIGDWVRLMRTPHYAQAYQAAVAGMANDFFIALQRAGYAGTNKAYVSLLQSTYEGVG